MKRLFWLGAALLLSGCVSGVYHGSSFPATDSLQIWQFDQPIPAGYRIIGRGRAWGEFSGTSQEELQEKLRCMGLQHGADAMKIIGSRVVRSGYAVNTAQYDFFEATDAPDQLETENAIYETVSPNPNAGETEYTRIMYAEFLKKHSP